MSGLHILYLVYFSLKYPVSLNNFDKRLLISHHIFIQFSQNLNFRISAFDIFLSILRNDKPTENKVKIRKSVALNPT